MKHRTTSYSAVLAVAALLLANNAFAFNFGNMMNPSKWMDNDDDYYDDEYYGGPGPYGPPPGYYGGPGFAPGYGAPGYGAPGYGAPGYGAPGYGGGYAAPAAPSAPPQGYGPDHNLPDTHSSYEYNRDKEEIARLKERIRKLEQASQQAPAPAAPSIYGNQPAYGSSQPAPATQPGWGSQPAYQQSPPASPPAGQQGWSNQPPYQYRQE